jgi:hypothetical protein
MAERMRVTSFIGGGLFDRDLGPRPGSDARTAALPGG